jgi:HME family heavy-metal exporter
MFKYLLDNSLTNRLLVIIASLVVMAYGAFTLTRTPVDVFPDLNKPTVTLMTEAGGMAPEEVEQLITFPLETTMNGLPGVESVRSVSSAGLSFIYVTFDWRTDIFRARQMVSERLTSMEEGLPEGVTPRMGPISSVMGEIMQIAIPIDTGKIHPHAGARIRRLGAAAAPDGDPRRRPGHSHRRRGAPVPGAAGYRAHGGTWCIAHDQLDDALRGFSANTSGGFLELNGREYLIRNLGRTSRLEDLKNLALTCTQRPAHPAAPDRRGDLRPGHQAWRCRLRGPPGGDPGHPEAADGGHHRPDPLHRGRPGLAEAGAAGEGMAEPRVTFRQASFIEASINTLQGKLIGASVFVAVILFFFLGTLRPTVIALTAIPVSIFMTALVFKYFGMSINTMTLGGLAIAIGGLVDDAVVGIENVLRRLEGGPDQAPGPSPASHRTGGQRHPGGAFRHPLRHPHHRAGVPAAVRPARHGGAGCSCRSGSPSSSRPWPPWWCRCPSPRCWRSTCCRV